MSAELSTNEMMAKILKDGIERREAAARDHSLQRLCCAAAECALLAAELDKRAENASEADHQSGEYGNLRHDSEILRIAQKAFEREQQHNDQAHLQTR